MTAGVVSGTEACVQVEVIGDAVAGVVDFACDGVCELDDVAVDFSGDAGVEDKEDSLIVIGVKGFVDFGGVSCGVEGDDEEICDAAVVVLHVIESVGEVIIGGVVVVEGAIAGGVAMCRLVAADVVVVGGVVVVEMVVIGRVAIRGTVEIDVVAIGVWTSVLFGCRAWLSSSAARAAGIERVTCGIMGASEVVEDAEVSESGIGCESTEKGRVDCGAGENNGEGDGNEEGDVKVAAGGILTGVMNPVKAAPLNIGGDVA